MSIDQIFLLIMSISGIIFGVSGVHTRRITTPTGLMGERTVFTGKSAILFGTIILTTGIALLFKGLVRQLLNDVSFLHIMAVYVFGFIVSLLTQFIENRIEQT